MTKEDEAIIAAIGTHANPKKIEGDKKVPLHLVPPQAVIWMAMAMKVGGENYGPYNWREDAIDIPTYYSAAMRHWMAVLDGEWIDPLSGQPHLAHAMACAGLVLDAHENDSLLTPVHTQGNAAELIRRITDAG